METPFFSIIMPVYQVEEYLEEAVKSVLAQSYENYELILVDDCSPDSCPEMCDEWTLKDSRIKVIHQKKNSGVSCARNTGMDAAAGQYLMFMDSDDSIDSSLLQKVFDSLQENRAEIVFFGMTIDLFGTDGKLKETAKIEPPQECFTTKESLRPYIIELENMTLYGYACNKFYDLDYLRGLGLRYEEYALNEDILFNVEYCMEIDKMNVLSIPAYHYRKMQVSKSRTGQFVKNYFELHVKRVQVILDQYKTWGMCTEKVKTDLAGIYTRYIMSALQRSCDVKAGMNHKARKEWLKKLYSQPLFNEIIDFGNSASLIVRVLNNSLKKRRVCFSLILGRFIYIVKNKLPGLFNIVQKKR